MPMQLREPCSGGGSKDRVRVSSLDAIACCRRIARDG